MLPHILSELAPEMCICHTYTHRGTLKSRHPYKDFWTFQKLRGLNAFWRAGQNTAEELP